MGAIKATIIDGNVTLHHPADIKGPVEAIVVVLDQDPWEALIRDPRPRPALILASNEALAEFSNGQVLPLDSDDFA